MKMIIAEFIWSIAVVFMTNDVNRPYISYVFLAGTALILASWVSHPLTEPPKEDNTSKEDVKDGRER